MAAESLTILPPGLKLPDGRVLTFPPHRRCPCRDCEAAFRAWDRGVLNLPYRVLP